MNVFERVAAEQDRQLEKRRDELPRVRRQLLAAASRARPERPSPKVRRWSFAVAALVLGAATLVLWPRERATSPLEPALAFRVNEAMGVVGQWASASAGRPESIRFSDGSRWILEPGARARVTELRPRGADLTLEAGLTHVSVVHREGSRWTVSAGPFQVLVTGTRFDVEWEPDADRFRVYLAEGAVTLKGCAFGDGRPLHQGERVEASCQSGRFQVTGGEPNSKASRQGKAVSTTGGSGEVRGAVSAEVSQPKQAGKVSSLQPPTARATPPAAPAWRRQLTDGDYDSLVAAKSAAQFRAACDAASSSQLSALGDAARFAGALGRARTAYVALRERFAGTPAAATAAFRLGRMDFDQRLSYRQAAKWFATYLGEQPGGPLAREALGRLVEARQRSGDDAGARAAATRYLETYPTGPHAPVARSVVGAPSGD